MCTKGGIKDPSKFCVIARRLNWSTIPSLQVSFLRQDIYHRLTSVCTAVEVILSKSKKEHLMMLYSIHAFAGTKDFLIAVARSRGRLKKGGIPDVPGAARSILRDWNAGRIPYYTVPPPIPSSSTLASASAGKAGSAAPAPSMLKSSDDIGSAAIVDALAPAFDLDSLFQEADSGALEGIKTSKEMGPGGAVRLNGSIASIDVVEGEFKLMGEEDEVRSIEEDEEEAPALVSALSAKASKKRRSDADELLPAAIRQKAKKVSFNETPAGPSGSGRLVSSQAAKMYADEPEEAPVQLNKSIKQQAKKDKKNKARAARHLAKDVDMAAGVLESFGVSDKTDQKADSAPKPYDFKAFFGGGASAVQDEVEYM